MTVRGSPQGHCLQGDVPGQPRIVRSLISNSHGDRTLVTIKQACCAPREPRDANGETET